jgi:hypothetical protein
MVSRVDKGSARVAQSDRSEFHQNVLRNLVESHKDWTIGINAQKTRLIVYRSSDPGDFKGDHNIQFTFEKNAKGRWMLSVNDNISTQSQYRFPKKAVQTLDRPMALTIHSLFEAASISTFDADVRNSITKQMIPR